MGLAVIAVVVVVALAGAALLIAMVTSSMSTSDDARPSAAPASAAVTGCPADLWLDPIALTCLDRTVCAGDQSYDRITNTCATLPVTLESLTPLSGPIAGGTELTITGSRFAEGASVTVDGIPATDVQVPDGTTITATTPAGLNLYAVDVTVTVPGEQPVTLNNVFTYLAPPDQSVREVQPAKGAQVGGETVVIKGKGFIDGVKVAFNLVLATDVVVLNSSTITVTTPAGPLGPVNVNVRNPDKEPLVLIDGFTYVDTAPRVVSAVRPGRGTTAGGTKVTVIGSGFAQGAKVVFGGQAATSVKVVSSTRITAVTPTGELGRADVVVRNPGLPRAILPKGFEYFEGPAVLSVSPAKGPAEGGTKVVITGTGFAKGARVTVGGAAATAVKVVSDTSITAVVPPGKAGPAPVTVTIAGQPPATLPKAFTYAAAPAPAPTDADADPDPCPVPAVHPACRDDAERSRPGNGQQPAVPCIEGAQGARADCRDLPREQRGRQRRDGELEGLAPVDHLARAGRARQGRIDRILLRGRELRGYRRRERRRGCHVLTPADGPAGRSRPPGSLWRHSR